MWTAFLKCFSHSFSVRNSILKSYKMIELFIAGIGMVLAGLLFDRVQHYPVFQDIHELFILVPPLLGLKGNLEMTLASRLSTAVRIFSFIYNFK